MTAKAGAAGEGTPTRRFHIRGITRPVWILSLVSFFADFSSEMVYPIIPLFITGTLGAPALAVGVVEGVAEGTANITKLISGRWADRFGARKPFVVAGYGLAAVGKLILGVATAWPIALVGRTSDRFGKGIRGAPRDALLADFTDDRNRGRVFGFHRSMDTLGAVVGPLVGLAFLEAGVQLRWVILLAVVPGIASVFVLKWLPERRPEPVAPGAERHVRGVSALPMSFYLLLGVMTVFMVGNSSDAFLILRSKDLGLSTTLVVLAYVCYNLVYTGLSFPAGVISDRVPRGWLMVAGMLVFAGVYLGFAQANRDWVVWPLFATYGVYIALTDGVSKALVADLAPKDIRSSAMGLFQGITGFAALAASIAAGVLWDQVSDRAPFALGAGCALVAAAGLTVMMLSGRLRKVA
ncbi:MAG: MFS transporter [Dehalococcoidia bacterium]|nr:MFS transporter [Dehalococcoidia bacterium]